MPKVNDPSLRQNLKRLWSQFSRQRRLDLLAVAGLTLTSSLAEMLSLGSVVPFLSVLADPKQIWGTGKGQWAAGLMGWQQPSDLVLPLCLAFASAAVLAGALRLLTLHKTIALANGIGSDLSIKIYWRTLYQPYCAHLQRNSSETISAVATEVDDVVAMINGLLQLLTAGLVSLGLVILLLCLNPWVMLSVAVAVGGGYGLLIKLSQDRLKRIGPEILKNQTLLIRSLQEGLGAIRDVILDNKQPTYTAIYGQADRRLRKHRGAGQFIAMAPRYGMEAVGLVAISLAALVLVSDKDGFLGALPVLGALALGAQRLLPSLQLIYCSWSGFRLYMPALSSVLGYLEQPVDEADLAPAQAPLHFESEIRFRHVSFRYGTHLPWILRNIELSIKPGDRIGIVGETGSGKSTLVDLLMGLLEPSQGEILVDGSPVQGALLRRWRGAIAHVPQSIFLADASIAENIAFGTPKASIDQARLDKVCQQAKIDGFIRSLDNGYDTRVGERGVRISGGQRQRLGIARALYKRAPILIFDEATSALDQSTEKEVMEAIDGLTADLTIVMIAHRLSTLSRCNRILNVKQGQVQIEEQIHP